MGLLGPSPLFLPNLELGQLQKAESLQRLALSPPSLAAGIAFKDSYG
jgi:hypothetical protein